MNFTQKKAFFLTGPDEPLRGDGPLAHVEVVPVWKGGEGRGDEKEVRERDEERGRGREEKTIGLNQNDQRRRDLPSQHRNRRINSPSRSSSLPQIAPHKHRNNKISLAGVSRAVKTETETNSPGKHVVPLLRPEKLPLGQIAPERRRVVDGLLPQPLVFREGTHLGLGRQRLGGRVDGLELVEDLRVV